MESYKKKLKTVKLIKNILGMALLCAIIIISIPVDIGYAAEGTQINVGMLLDEGFEMLTGDQSQGFTKNKISGWEVYTTGGMYSYYPWEWFKLADNNAGDGITLKKRFTKQSQGKITFCFRFKMPTKADGMNWQLNSGSRPGMRILTSGGNLCYTSSGGNAITLQSYNADTEYGVKVIADLSTKTADIYVNGTLRATGASVMNSVKEFDYVEIKTSESMTGEIYLKPIRVYKGYDVFEDFESTMENVPADWAVTGSGGTVTVNMNKSQMAPYIYSLKLEDTSTSASKSVSKAFSNVTGKSVFEYYFLLPSKVDGMSADIKSSATTAVRIMTNNGHICYQNSGGNYISIWDNYMANVWYKIKVVADPAYDTADIYVNGKLRATGVSFRNSVNGFDSILYSTPASEMGIWWVDDIKFYPYQDYPSDYVPEPAPVASTGYYVGMQSMPQSLIGNHIGWQYVYEWPEHDLYMGTYDENLPEAADWILKFQAEHGVDFFFDCWYGNRWFDDPFGPDTLNITPFKYPNHGHYIHDAYFNAKYSNSVKFAISTYYLYMTKEYFRNILVPYLIEHYFKDSRYMTIDNKVIIAFNQWAFWDAASDAEVKAELDYLRQKCVEIGYDGAYILTWYEGADLSQMNTFYAQGFDYAFAYHYGFGETDINVMEQKICAQRDAGSNLGVIACPSVGVSWEGLCSNIAAYTGHVSVNNFQTFCNWIRDTYMPPLPSSNLGKKLVLVDNWSEYAEGHWVNPGSLAEFGYLDALRNTFAGGGSHTDIKPNPAQKQRLNQSFPLGWNGHVWNFDSSSRTWNGSAWVFDASYVDTEGWSDTAPVQINPLFNLDGYLYGGITGNDPYITSRDNLGIDLASNNLIKIRYNNSSAGTTAKVCFTTTADTTWDSAKSKEFEIVANDTGYHEYVVDMTGVPGWTGTLKQLRFHPVETGASSGAFSIDYIILTDDSTKQWAFTSDIENWTVCTNVSGFGWQAGGYVGGTITATDPNILSVDNVDADIVNNKIVKIRMKNSTSSTTGQIYFTTYADTTWNETKHKDFTIIANDPFYTEYYIDMSDAPEWTGTLKQLRLDPL